MRKWENFILGWHHATNSNKFHWFNTQDKPLCNAHVKGMPQAFLKPYQHCFGTDKNVNKYTGHCTKCISKLHNK